MKLKEIPIDKIKPNPLQPREHFDKEKIEELASSIKEVNLLQPILVRPKGKYFEIISGERRWKAAQVAKLKKLLAIIKTTDNGQLLVESLIENVHREDLTVPEKIKALEKIRKLKKIPHSRGLYTKLSKITGIPDHSISMWYDEFDVRKKLRDDISSTVIQETKGLPEPERIKLLKIAEKKDIGGRKIRNYIETIKKASEPVKERLLEPSSKLTLEEAEIIDTQLPTIEEKEWVLQRLEKKKPLDIKLLITTAKKEKKGLSEIDTGEIWKCPICKNRYRLIHKTSKSHVLEEVA
jgi:hypothetical protein